MLKELFYIFLSAVLVNNFVLTYFLGICPFLGVSNRIESAVGMGCATTFVMTFASTISWLIYYFFLEKFALSAFLGYSVFILVIACLVQLVEMFIRKYSPGLYYALGIYLPLITTNCAILGLCLFMVIRNYGFLESIVFGFSSGIGFSLVLLMMAGIREHLDSCDVPGVFKGASITLITSGILALAFMGFGGIIK